MFRSYLCAVFVILSQFCFILYLQYTVNITQNTIKHSNFNPHEPIDVVYTWVNGSDPRFLRDLHHHTAANKVRKSEDINGDRRYAEKHELLYSLRSIEKNMPWIRHVYIVTNGQIPAWLNLDNNRATIIPHSTIFPNQEDLPTFSSPAIEANLHRIPGISRRFLYFNDDWLVGAPVEYSTFYTPTDGHLVYWEFGVPPCGHLCSWYKIGDGRCHLECYRDECQMDGGDCDSIEDKSKLETYNRLPRIAESVYGGSLQYTQRLFNLKFGFKQRFVMPHIPTLVDVNIMTDAWQDYHAELKNTSSHKFRDGTDLQFEFFYTFYMLEKKKTLKLSEALLKYDSTPDGVLSQEEVNVMIINHFENIALGHPRAEQRNHFMSILTNCSKDLRIKELQDCPLLEDLLKDSLRLTQGYTSISMGKIPTDGFYYFGMLRSNLPFVVNLLNNVIKYPRKFICLNDDLTHTPLMVKTNRKIYAELALFYERMFPLPSKYELPKGRRNPPEKYIQEMRLETKTVSGYHKNVQAVYLFVVIAFVLVILMYIILKIKCCFRRNVLKK